MRSPRLALAVFMALTGCGDDGNSANDGGGGSGDDGGGSGSGDGGTECVLPDPLPACATPSAGTTMSLVQVGNTSAFAGQPDTAAVLVTSPPRDPRQFVVGRGGQIRIIENGVINTDPFFDLDTAVTNLETGNGEQGLLGLAFHPKYACNGEFYVFYTSSGGAPFEDVVLRCHVSATNPNKADTACTPVLRIPDFAANHNGGMMEFGNDGFLYIGTGDGGSGGDPRRNGQALVDNGNTVALLGKMLRIDVDNRDPGKEYAIPASNPFAGGGGAPEIWMIGLRNPWRWSFDRETGDIWIGDVGQIKTEELTAIKAGEQSGKNLGWSVWEGDRCCATLGTADGLPDPDASQNGCEQNGTQQTCNMSAPGLVFPQRFYRHGQASPAWISIIGGQTYRGTCYPDIVGWHFYTDHQSTAAGLHRARFMTGSNDLETFDYPTNAPSLPGNITSIHADARGEIYVTRLNGTVYHLVAAP